MSYHKNKKFHDGKVITVKKIKVEIPFDDWSDNTTFQTMNKQIIHLYIEEKRMRKENPYIFEQYLFNAILDSGELKYEDLCSLEHWDLRNTKFYTLGYLPCNKLEQERYFTEVGERISFIRESMGQSSLSYYHTCILEDDAPISSSITRST